jgi:hypothetical protein
MDSKMDIDVGKPTTHDSMPPSDSHSTGDLDAWISQLLQLKQLSESDVARLCEMARDVLQEESNVQAVVSFSNLHPSLSHPHPHSPTIIRKLQLLSLEISMDSFTIYWKCFALVAILQTRITFLWVSSLPDIHLSLQPLPLTSI